MSRLNEINDRLAVVQRALLELEDRVELNEEDAQIQDDLLGEHETLMAERDPLQAEFDAYQAQRAQRMEAVLAAARDSANREAGGDRSRGGPTLMSRTVRDPFDGISRGSSLASMRHGDIMTRARYAVDDANDAKTNMYRGASLSDARAEAVHALLDTDDGSTFGDGKRRQNEIAKHILRTGSPEYLEAFHAYLENPEENLSRAALSLTNVNGGYLLPYILDPTIVLTNNSSANPYRRISNMKTTTSNAWQGVTSAGVTAGWLAEGAPAPDASPTVGQIQITPQKASAWVFGSYEVLADTDFAQQLPALLSDAKDRLEEAAFTTGTSGSGQPVGVVTGATTLVNTITTLVYAVGDVYATQAALPPRFRTSDSVAWVMNVAYINKSRQFDTAGGASFWTNLGKGQPETLLGAPIYESTTMFGGTQGVGSKIAVFGDFSNYYIVDRVGVSLIYEPLVKDQATQRPTGQGGWFLFWRVGANVSTPAAFRTLNGT